MPAEPKPGERETESRFYKVWLSIQLPWQLVLMDCPALLFDHRESERSREKKNDREKQRGRIGAERR